MHPVLLKFGPITIYSYGLFVALAFLVTSFLITRDSHLYGIAQDRVWDILFAILISGIVGARLVHVLLNFEYYREFPLEAVMLHKGGLAIQGGIAAAIIFTAVFLLKKGHSFWATGDLVMQFLPLGQAIGRIGCFLNGCCGGIPSRYPFGIIFPGGAEAYHPTQVYLSLMLLSVFGMLRYMAVFRKRAFVGEIFLTYFIIYCPLRFYVDFLRGDLPEVAWGLTMSQIISSAMFTAAATIYIIKKAKGVKAA